MRKRIMVLFLGIVLACVLVACGNEADTKDGGIEIDKAILAVAEENASFNTDKIIEGANNRVKKDPEFYAGSKVPKLDSCVTGIVYEAADSKDGSYVYCFGEGEDAKNEEMYLSAICAYYAHLKALGLTYELNEHEMCYIYDGNKVVANFMIFNTTDKGYMMMITPK